MRDVNLTWYVGLDAEATRIGDALWNGEELDEAARERVVGLFRLTFRDPDVVLDKVRGEPVYLILAMTPDKMLRMKPQNLVDRLADPASGGGDLSAAPRCSAFRSASWSSAARRDSQWIDFIWQPVAVLAGEPDAAPWTMLLERRRARRSMPAAPTIELYRTETAQLSRQSRAGDARAVGRAAADRRRAALRACSRSPPIPPRARP